MAPYIGRGGWTWYNGSAGWLYRAGLEAILGFQLQGQHLLLSPCIQKCWPSYEIVYRHRGKPGTFTCYQIAVENPAGVYSGIVLMELDSVQQANSTKDSAQVALSNDGLTHRVRIVLG